MRVGMVSGRVVAAICLLAAGAGVQAQATARPVGTIILAHGGDARWNERVAAVAREVRTGGPIEVSFLMGPEAARRRFQDAVARLESQGVSSIVVVPMLVSSHSGHYEQVRWLAGEDVALDSVMHHHLHMAGIERATTTLPIHVTAAMDDAPEVARVLADRGLALAPQPNERALFIVGHGPNSAEDHAAWMKNLRVLADSVRVVHVARVAEVVYSPGEQAVVVDLRDAADRSMTLVRRHHRAAPHAIDAVAVAAKSGRLRFVSGDVRLVGGELLIDPLGLVVDETVIVPDLEGPQPAWQARAGVFDEPSTPAHDAVRAGWSTLEEACHLGVSRLPLGWRERASNACLRLDGVGLAGSARRLRKLVDAVVAGGDATDAWLSAAVRLALTDERT